MEVKQFILSLSILLCTVNTHVHAENVTTWPDIPLLTITTENGEFPTCDIVYPPEGCVGTGITNAEYVPGRLIMTIKGETLYDSGDYVKDESGMRIKIRGNSTGASAGQKPYKIKLSKKFDMLCRGDEDYEEKDWNLLKISTWNPGLKNNESNILTVLGFIVSKAVGMEWTPDYKFVNLVMNDKYMGLYYLTDAIERGDKRVDIEKSGYLIENDAYYWNEDVSFKTNHQPTEVGYTYKYPDADDVDENTTLKIKTYINEFEDALYNEVEEEDVSEYIDLHTFAKWILAHDILNSNDGLGSNMYIYKYDFDEANPKSTKLKMGPLWDFDSAFKDPEASGEWCALHETFYWEQLFCLPNFIEAYTAAWNEVKPDLLDNVVKGFDGLKSEYGNSLEESFTLHKSIYPNECQNSLQAQIDELTENIRNRTAALDILIKQLHESSGINIAVNAEKPVPVHVFDICGTKYEAVDFNVLPKGIYIVKYDNGTTKKILKDK